MLNIKPNKFLDKLSDAIFESTGKRTKRYCFNALCRYADKVKQDKLLSDLMEAEKEDSDKIINFSNVIDKAEKKNISFSEALKNCITYDVEPEPTN